MSRLDESRSLSFTAAIFYLSHYSNTMNANERKKRKMIPLSSLERFHIIIRDFFIHMRTSVILPYPLYFIYEIFFVAQSTFPVNANMNDVLWPSSYQPFVVYRLMTGFIKIGFVSTDYKGNLIEEIIFYTLLVLFNVPAIIALVIFISVGRVNNIFLSFVDYTYEFVFPILMSSCPTKIGFFIASLINDDLEIPITFAITSIIVRFIFLSISVFFYHNYIYSQLAYYPGSSITWSGSSMTYVRMMIDFILMISRITECSKGKTLVGLFIFLVVLSIISLLIDVRTFPFIKPGITVMHCGA